MKRFVAILGALALALVPALAGTFQPGFRGAPVAPVALSGTVYQTATQTFSPVSGAGGTAGQLMVVAAYVILSDPSSVSVTAATPSGWTNVVWNTSFPLPNQASAAGLWYKYLNGTETGSIGFWSATGSSQVYYIQALKFTGGKGVVSASASAVAGGINTSTTSTVASSGQPVSQLLLGIMTRQATNVSGSFTPTADNSYELGSTAGGAGGMYGRFYYRINNTTATTVQGASSDSSNRMTIALVSALAL